MSKTTLKSYDLQCAVSANQQSEREEDVTITVIGQLVMIFMMCSKGGVSLSKDILSQVRMHFAYIIKVICLACD